MSDSIRIDSGQLSPTQSADAGKSDLALKSRDLIFSSSLRKSHSFLHLKTISLKETAGKTAKSYSAPSSPTSNAPFKPFSLPESVTNSAAGSMLESSPKGKQSESAAFGSLFKPPSFSGEGAESESKSHSPKATSAPSAAPSHRRDVMGYALLQNRDMKFTHRRGKVFLGTPSSTSPTESKRSTPSESASKGSLSSMRSSSVSPTNAMRIGSPVSDSASEGSEPSTPRMTPASIELRMESPTTVSSSKGSAASSSKSASSPMNTFEESEQKSVHIRQKNYLLLPSNAFPMPTHRRATKNDYALLSESELDLVIRIHRRYRDRYLILPISAFRVHRRGEPLPSDFDLSDSSDLRDKSGLRKNSETESLQDLPVEPELALLSEAPLSPVPVSEFMQDGSSPSPFRPNGSGATPSPPSSEPNSPCASPVEEPLN